MTWLNDPQMLVTVSTWLGLSKAICPIMHACVTNMNCMKCLFNIAVFESSPVHANLFHLFWIVGDNWNNYFKGHREVLNLSSDPEVHSQLVFTLILAIIYHILYVTDRLISCPRFRWNKFKVRILSM